MLRLNQIHDFLTALDCASIRSAARRLGVSQPAVTKSIRMLESELGTELLHRTSGGVTPTAAGRAFAARARVAQHELNQGREEVSAVSGNKSASLSVGIGSAPAALFAVEAISRYRVQRPDDRIRIIEGAGQALLPLVRDATIDVAIAQRVKPQDAPGLKYRPLLRTRLVVVGRHGHPLSFARSLSELSTAQWLVYRSPGSGGILEEALAAEGLPFPSRYVHCESLAMTVALIAGSDLIGLLVPHLLHHPLAQSHLEEIRLNRPLPAISIGLYRRADAPLSTAVTFFWATLTAAAQTHTHPAVA